MLVCVFMNTSHRSCIERLSSWTLCVAVAYDSDLEAVKRIMLAAAVNHPRVWAEPAPAVMLRQFGADGLDLEMGFWIRDPEQGSLNVRSDINFAIWRGFQEGGISIPYPQREVRLVRVADAQDTVAEKSGVVPTKPRI